MTSGLVHDDACARLLARTPATWATAQLAHGAELLVDQAHLEKKAAASAVAFLFRGLPAPAQRALSGLAREELVHFERTLRLLERRAIAFVRQQPVAYAERLKAAVLRTMPERLVDELLVAAIIEARSCERMALLAAALRAVDAELAAFYEDLCEAERRHESVYVRLAAELAPARAASRLGELCAHEARVVDSLAWSPRLHSGWPGAAHGD